MPSSRVEAWIGYGRRVRRLRHGVWAGVVALAGMVCVFVVGIQPAASQPNDNEKKVRICHATSAETNPYIENEPAIANNGDLNGGHLDHKGPVFPAADWGDIIPPYEYVDDKGVTQIFPGYNWTPRGQAIWENGCEAALRVLVPMLECVDAAPGGGFLAHFGYQNPNPDPVVVPFENTFVPDPANRGQPTVFAAGPGEDAFQAASTGSALTWKLTGNRVTASSDSKPSCRGSITIVKVLHPSNDPGRFHLEIDGVTAGGATAVGDGGTTGTVAVSPGAHTVGESAAARHEPRRLRRADRLRERRQGRCRSGERHGFRAGSAWRGCPVHDHEHSQVRVEAAGAGARVRRLPRRRLPSRRSGAIATTTTSRFKSRSARRTGSRPRPPTAASRSCSSRDAG